MVAVNEVLDEDELAELDRDSLQSIIDYFEARIDELDPDGDRHDDKTPDEAYQRAWKDAMESVYLLQMKAARENFDGDAELPDAFSSE